jgi:hypothetical protein
MMKFKVSSLALSFITLATSLSGCGFPQSESLGSISSPDAYSTAPTDWHEITIMDNMNNEINYAFEESSAKGFEAVFRHIYPNSLDLDKAAACAQALVDQGETWWMKFGSSGASLLTKWVAPENSADDWIFAGQSPEGNTYEGVGSFVGSSIGAGMGIMHVTVLNDQAYLFMPFCVDR